MKKLTLTQNTVYRFNLYDDIETFDQYEEFFEEVPRFSSSDRVLLYINSPGGRVDVGVSIINTLNQCPAPITAVVEGPSYSMASVIALACDDLLMLDNTFLMFHNYSTISYGKGAELMSSMHHNDRHMGKLMDDVCYPFLTKAELKKIKNDQDIYIYDDDATLDKRKARHFK